MKYPMKEKTEQPLFNYLVRYDNSDDYYLFDEFNDALNKMKELSATGIISLIYEISFNTISREFYLQNTFDCFYGVIEYDKHAKVELHVHHYVNVGEWLNPNEEWIKILSKKENNK